MPNPGSINIRIARCVQICAIQTTSSTSAAPPGGCALEAPFESLRRGKQRALRNPQSTQEFLGYIACSKFILQGSHQF